MEQFVVITPNASSDIDIKVINSLQTGKTSEVFWDLTDQMQI